MLKKIMFGLTITGFICVWLGTALSAPLNLRVSSWMPAKSVDTEVAEIWTKAVEEMTGDELKFTLYLAGALGNMKDQYDLVVNGVADISFHTLSNNPGRHAICEVLHLPFVIPNSTVGGLVFWDLYNEFPEIQAEFTDVQIIGLGTIDPWNLQTLSKPVKTLEDLKGLKIRVPGGDASEAIKLLGAVPMGVPAPEVYIALQKKVVDGTVWGYEGVKSFKGYELLKYYTDVDGFTTLAQGVFMNKRTFNKLSPEAKKIVTEIMGYQWFTTEKSKIYDRWAKDGLDTAMASGGEVYYLPEAEKARWVEAILPVRQAWVDKMTAKGFNAQKILDRALELSAKYSAMQKQ